MKLVSQTVLLDDPEQADHMLEVGIGQIKQCLEEEQKRATTGMVAFTAVA